MPKKSQAGQEVFDMRIISNQLWNQAHGIMKNRTMIIIILASAALVYYFAIHRRRK